MGLTQSREASGSGTTSTAIITHRPDLPLRDLSGRVRLRGHLVGRGGFGTIHLGDADLHDSGHFEVVAVKVPIIQGYTSYSPKDREKVIQRFFREARVWNSFHHPNIMPFYGYFKDPTFFDSPCLVMPFFFNGDIYQYLSKQPQADRLRLVIQVALGIQYMHQRDAIHGDIKASNVLIDDRGQAVLTDFGLTRIPDTSDVTTENLHGNYRWMAPELLSFHTWLAQQDFSTVSHIPHPPRHSKSSDIWAFGLTILEIFTQRPPFCSVQHKVALAHSIVSHNRLPVREECPEVPHRVWKGLNCSGCWKHQPERRPSIEQLLLVLTGL